MQKVFTSNKIEKAKCQNALRIKGLWHFFTSNIVLQKTRFSKCQKHFWTEKSEIFARKLKKQNKTGYSDKTIRWHINKGRIFTILQDRKFLVSKYSLIKFLSSDKGFAMQPKSEWHEKAIRWFIKEMYKG